jgi:hypothetical protein
MSCERYEAALSTLADGELEPVDLLATVDHLADCEACREFYGQLRELDGVLMEVEGLDVAHAVPPNGWQRIVAGRSRSEPVSAPLSGRAVRPRSNMLTWGAAIAASLVLSFALWDATTTPRPSADSGVSSGMLEITLEQDRGRMTEQRFVELVTEVLRSDRRYHRKMHEVMGAVTRSTTGREGPVGDADRSPDLVLPAVEAADGRADRDGRRL